MRLPRLRQSLLVQGLFVRGLLVRGLLASLTWGVWSTGAQAYERITDTDEIVLNKLFPKQGKVELDGRFGVMLNSSYVNSFMATGGFSYFWSEEWGFSGEGSLVLNNDKSERYCIERFYNQQGGYPPGECQVEGEPNPFTGQRTGDQALANYGPAYVPIREVKYILTGDAVWNPMYGKQIILLSATNYFDFFLKVGGGLAISDYYPLQETIKSSGKPSRGRTFIKDGPGKENNPGTLIEADVGIDGRPEPLAETTPLLHLAAGQRYHFLKRFLVSASLDSYTLLGTPTGIEFFLSISGGLGVRF